MADMLHRETAEIVADDDTNTVVVQLAEYGTPREVNDGRGLYREAIDSLKLRENVYVKSRHGGDVIGHADVATFRETPNPQIDLVIADTSAGRDTMALIRSGSLGAVSVEMLPGPADKKIDGVLHRADALVHGIAMAINPVHISPILATREHEETPMDTDNTPTELPADLIRSADLEHELTELRREIPTMLQRDSAPDPYARLREFDNLGSATRVAFRDTEIAGELHRALAEQTTPNNEGLIPPAWVTDIKGIVAANRPVIGSFGTEALPGSGMDVDYPFSPRGGDNSGLVGEQALELAEILSVQVDIERGTSPIKTYAGGSAISLQLIERSSPAYLAAYLRIMAQGMAYTSDSAAGAAFISAGTASSATWAPVGGTAAQLREALFTASVEVEAATGSPAGFVLAATDVWTAIGGLADLLPPQYGTQNVSGTSSASALRINVSGLDVRHARGLAAGSFVVSNSIAGSVMETGTRTVTSADVERLGQNVAVYNMMSVLPYVPAGIRTVAAA